MGRTCCVVSCNARSHNHKGRKLDNGLSFCGFPSWKKLQGGIVSDITKRRRMARLAAVRHPKIKFASIQRYMKVCSRHFHSGEFFDHLLLVMRKIRFYCIITATETAKKQKQTFSFSQISSHPDKVNYYTGLPDAATVLFLEALLSKFDLQYHFDWNVQIMPLIDQLLLTLMKLRLNCGILDLATRFNCSRATVTNIFTTISSALYDILYVGMMENNIPSRVKNQTSLPVCFQPFPDCQIVLDCTEVAVSNTERLDTQSHLYSHYKGRTTLKALNGVAPNGVITFASDLYGGSTSDKAITADCGVLQQLQPGDVVMADEGFTIRDILPEGVSLNIPTLLVNGQFTVQEVNHNRLVASARIHVEHSIRLKTFAILTYIPYQYKKHANKILKVGVCLTNLQKPILREIA
uniref:THAP-type domain-containing protein n=1 Tax=Sparus aurata TaxID=8175 RepID=A0A671TH52_SPAAU